jgi:hypothetical protein
VSSGLKRTYHKKLEIFECTAVEANTSIYAYAQKGYYVNSIQYVHAYHPKKGWVKKPYTKSSLNSSAMTRYSTICHTTNTSQNVLYSTLKAAQVSKLLLIKSMENKYKKAIKELEDTFARNVPAYKEPLNHLLDQHPDLFL